MLVRILLLILGLCIFAISLGFIIMGPLWTYTTLATNLHLELIDISAFNSPFVDGTVRFLAVFAVVFSLIVMNSARDYQDNQGLVPILMVILALAGAARIWSIFKISDTSLISLTASLAEILPAVLIFILYFMSGKRREY